MNPTIIEVAINGETQRSRNIHVPLSPSEIAEDAITCLARGASIIHNHMGDITLAGGPAADRYGQAWAPILDKFPEAILCPTSVLVPDVVLSVAHIAPCVAAGARMASLDPGVENFANSGKGGLPGPRRGMLANSIDKIEIILDTMRDACAGPALGIYEPGFLRPILAYRRAGILPRGTLAKLYFGGDCNLMDGGQGGFSFGLPPTRAALDAYVEMLEGSGLPWSVAVPGGDVVRSGLARFALERGGHLRIGIEDYAGGRMPTNIELLDEAVTLCHEMGRPPATCAQAAVILDLP